MGAGDYYLRIKELPLGERPYEKLEKYGQEALSNAELMAIIIKTGTKKATSVDIGRRILKKYSGNKGLSFLYDISLEELKSIKGIGRVKAIQLKAAVELGKRVFNPGSNDNKFISCPADVSKLVMDEMRYLKQEHFRVIMLNTKNYVLKILNVSVGTLDISIVHPRDVFSEAIREKCSSIILVHNHPSGEPTPSKEDITATKRIIKSGEILGIEVLDHIIIGDGKYISLKESGIV